MNPETYFSFCKEDASRWTCECIWVATYF